MPPLDEENNLHFSDPREEEESKIVAMFKPLAESARSHPFGLIFNGCSAIFIHNINCTISWCLAKWSLLQISVHSE